MRQAMTDHINQHFADRRAFDRAASKVRAPVKQDSRDWTEWLLLGAIAVAFLACLISANPTLIEGMF
jgi:hypothetical protein